MSERDLRFNPDIPDGWCKWDNQIEVAGTGHHIDAAVAFAQAEHQTLTLEPEPTNPHDPNAIRVVGWAHDAGAFRPYFVGYVLKEVAKALPPEYKPCLRNIWLGGYHQPVVYIRFDLLVPKPPQEVIDAERAKRKKKAASRNRKVSKPIERPALLVSPYLLEYPNQPPSHTYCEKCKYAHSGDVCPTCGNDHRSGSADNNCDYCNTDFRANRKFDTPRRSRQV